MRSTTFALCVLTSTAWAQSITVTATRGVSEDAAAAHPNLYIRTQSAAPASVDQLLDHTPGVTLQRTTPGQASPLLRGLTGYHTLLLLDGVRLNTAIFRSGPNQYSALVDPSQVSQAEVLLGPASASYGSDALGGAVHFVTPASAPRFSLPVASATGDLSSTLAPRAGFDTARFALLGSAFFRRHNDLRPGAGLDTHNVFTRLAGYTPAEARALLGPRLHETAYSQAGYQAKLIAKLAAESRLTFFFQRGAQYGLRGYRELTGGLGRLQALYEPQSLDLFYARYERPHFLFLERPSLTLSLNRQRDHSLRQGAQPTDAVITDRNSVDAWSLTAQASRQLPSQLLLLGGADLHRERIHSYRSVMPAQYPDNSLYSTAAPFVQSTWHPRQGRLLLRAGLRYNSHSLLPQRQRFGAAAMNASSSLRLAGALELIAIFSQGFRAPNMSDLAATGLTGLGFEIPAATAARAGALVALDASEAALPRGAQRLRPLGSERLNNYELGLRYRTSRLTARVQGFSNFFDQPIVRRTVLFPVAAVPATLDGIAVTPLAQSAAQRAAQVVTVATSYDSRAVKTYLNDGGLRYQGLSADLEFKPTARWFLTTSYAYLNGREILPNRAPRRLPPQQGFFRALYSPTARLFAQFSLAVSGGQDKLSAGDIDDERMGAARSRKDIAAFLASPAGRNVTASPTSIIPLAVAASDSTRVPLYTRLAGWTRADAALGFRCSRQWRITAGVDNIADTNYRTLGSGAEALGRSFFARTEFQF